MDESRRIRLGIPADFAALAEVMFDAVRNGKSEYTEAQREAWVPEIRSGEMWANRLAAQDLFVAEDEKQIVGFMSLADEGYVDFAYIRPAEQGSGLFRQLYESLEKHAISIGLQRLWVHASLMAQPAFSAMGFEILEEQRVKIGDQTLRRFELEKWL
ncbi:MAG: GNAT family N-acetyltransferase [Planctomycetota bacterium]|nr:GNAT family N-acetyltransferase [Planctomycetota bacterium]